MAIIQDVFKAGLSFKARVVCPAHPAPDWTVRLILRGKKAIDLTATGEESTHSFMVGADETSSWDGGLYAYSLRATNGQEVVEIEAGNIEIIPDLQQQLDGFDGRSHAEKILEAIEATLENRATKDQLRYVIQGGNGSRREIWRNTIPELMQLRTQYRKEVASEKARKKGVPLFRPIKVRFERV